MIKFRSRTEDGEITPEISLATYLATLYTAPQQALPPARRSVPTEEGDTISIEQLNLARKRLSRNKAIGIYLLPDKHFHNEILWAEMS